jgi:hypothetical protein
MEEQPMQIESTKESTDQILDTIHEIPNPATLEGWFQTHFEAIRAYKTKPFPPQKCVAVKTTFKENLQLLERIPDDPKFQKLQIIKCILNQERTQSILILQSQHKVKPKSIMMKVPDVIPQKPREPDLTMLPEFPNPFISVSVEVTKELSTNSKLIMRLMTLMCLVTIQNQTVLPFMPLAPIILPSPSKSVHKLNMTLDIEVEKNVITVQSQPAVLILDPRLNELGVVARTLTFSAKKNNDNDKDENRTPSFGGTPNNNAYLTQ